MSAADRESAETPSELADALVKVLRPLAQLCIANGLPFFELEESLKGAYVEAAMAGASEAARRVSRVSTTTGISRHWSSHRGSRPVGSARFAGRCRPAC